MFAPAVALVDRVFVGGVLRAGWRQGERQEWIVVTGRVLEVRRSALGRTGVQRTVRVDAAGAGDRGQTRVLLRSMRQVEIGAFPTEPERPDLAGRLEILLDRAKHPVRDTNNQLRSTQ